MGVHYERSGKNQKRYVSLLRFSFSISRRLYDLHKLRLGSLRRLILIFLIVSVNYSCNHLVIYMRPLKIDEDEDWEDEEDFDEEEWDEEEG